MAKALLISMEGLDGVGKSTQLSNIRLFFEEQGRDCVVFREPGGTSIGEQLREILLSAKNNGMSAKTELLLFAAARAQLVEERIRPALAEGKVVICDRFLDSTLAYQAGGRGLDVAVVRQSILLATAGLVPDVTFFLDLPPQVAAIRLSSRAAGEAPDRIEQEQSDFRSRVRDAYLRLARTEDRIVTIHGGGTPEGVFAEIKKVLTALT